MNALDKYVNNSSRFSADKDHDVYDHTTETWDRSQYAVVKAFAELMNAQGINKDDMRTALNQTNKVYADDKNDVKYYDTTGIYFDLNQQWNLYKYAVERAYFVIVIRTQGSNLAGSSQSHEEAASRVDWNDWKVFSTQNSAGTCWGGAALWLTHLLKGGSLETSDPSEERAREI